MPSVVSITNVGTTEFQTFFGTYEQESQSSGSGIIIGKNDTELLIVTNNHVISNAKEISVYFNSDGEDADEDNVISAKIKGTDVNKDLAVISVALEDIPQETLDIVKIATIGDSAMLEIGEPVVAIGNAYGYGLSVTSGIVSALNREVSVQSDGQTITNKLIQTDAAINPGNSGGALLNSKGELIGINSVKFISEDVEGMGYAIPISDVESIIGDLMNKVMRDQVKEVDRGYLGINGVDVTSDVSKSYGMPIGAYVDKVVDGAAAQKAGIQKGDIITKLDGSSITSYNQLKEALSYYAAGETVPITIQRLDGPEYKEITLDITLSTSLQAGVKSEE
ncbi:MAG TPA: serine protease [Lachnospiraceae bacterium]|nr:serine protease [Lachnospiraceae bacterium]